MGNMALMKGNHHHHHRGNNCNGGGGNRKKPCGLVVLAVFCASVAAILLLHKLREKRMFNLLAKEKDLELASLHLLLEKERENTKDIKWKLEEVKGKVNALRAHKRILDSRILELQSTASSLKDEQRVIESALVEKQNEIMLWKERSSSSSDDNIRLEQLTELLRDKELEIEDLKNRLRQPPAKVWSVSLDDPANLSLNSETEASEPVDSGRMAMDNRTIAKEGKGVEAVQGGGGELAERNDEEGINSTGVQTEEASGMKGSQLPERIQTDEKHENQGHIAREEVLAGHFTESERLQTGKGNQGQVSSLQQVAERQDWGTNHKGGMKFETFNEMQIGRHGMDGKGHSKRRKRKKLNRNPMDRANIWRPGQNEGAASREMGKLGSETGDDDEYHGTMHRNGDLFNRLRSGSVSDVEDHDTKMGDQPVKEEFLQQETNKMQGSEPGEERKTFSLENDENKMKMAFHGTELVNKSGDLEDFTTHATSYVKSEEVQIVNKTDERTGSDGIAQKKEQFSETKQMSQIESQVSENQARGFQEPEERIEGSHKELYEANEQSVTGTGHQDSEFSDKIDHGNREKNLVFG